MKQTDGVIETSKDCKAFKNAAEHGSRSILGVDVEVLALQDAIGIVGETLHIKGHRKFAFLNAHGANLAHTNSAYRNVLSKFTVFSDGIGVDLGSKILYGHSFPANLNGTDFIPKLLAQAKEGTHVALLGAQPGVAEKAIEKLRKRFPQNRYSFVRDGFFDVTHEQQILNELADDRPDILLVAFGNPKQELWIADNVSAEHALTVFGVGALFDFIAERVPRAPKLLIMLRLEWLYRLLIEPKRMWRRYVLGNPAFIVRVLKQKLFGAKIHER